MRGTGLSSEIIVLKTVHPGYLAELFQKKKKKIPRAFVMCSLDVMRQLPVTSGDRNRFSWDIAVSSPPQTGACLSERSTFNERKGRCRPLEGEKSASKGTVSP